MTTSFDVEKHVFYGSLLAIHNNNYEFIIIKWQFLAIHNNNYNKYFNELGIKGMCLNVVKDIHGKVTITSYPVLKPQSFPLRSVTR